jgi:hypothetical protein
VKYDRIGTFQTPALAVYRDQLHMVWRGADGNEGIWHASNATLDPTADNNGWSTQEPVPGVATNDIPALAVYQDRLHMAWRGIAGDTGLWHTSFGDDGWRPQDPVRSPVGGMASAAGPSLATYGGRLHMVWRGIPDDLNLCHSTFDGQGWAPQESIPGTASVFGPTIAAYDGVMFMAWRGVQFVGDTGPSVDDETVYLKYFVGNQWTRNLFAFTDRATATIPVLGLYTPFLAQEEVFWLGAAGDVSSNWRNDNVDNGAWHTQFAIAIPNSVRAGSLLAAISRNPHHEEVFWVGAASDVSSNWRNDNLDKGAWHQQFAIASPNSVRGDSPLVAISRNPSHEEVFWIGAGSDVSSNWRDDNLDSGAWHQQFAVARPNSVRAGSPLVALSRSPHQVELFWIGAPGDVSSTWQNDNLDNGAWHTQFAIALPNSVRGDSPLVALSRNPIQEEVFWVGAAGAVSSNWRNDNLDNGAWHQQFAIARPNSVRAASPLVTLSRDPSHEEVFWIGADGDVSSNWRNDNLDNGAWHTQFAIAFPNSVRGDSPLVAISRSPSHEEVFWIGADGGVSSTWRDDNVDNGAWHPQFSIALPNSVRAGSPLVAISRNPHQVEVFWIGAGGDISSTWQNDLLDKGAWHPQFAIALPNTVPAGSSLATIVRNPS